MSTKPKNFRMSRDAVELLGKIATKYNITETAVLEHCVARYAAELGLDIDRAKAVLLEHVAKAIAATEGKRRDRRN